MAQKKKKIIGYNGGLESKLPGLAMLLIILGVLGLAGSIVISIEISESSIYDNWWENGISLLWVCSGISSFIALLVWASFLLLGAEILQLLKKANNLHYGGELSVAKEVTNLICSDCGVVAYSSDKKCKGCKEPFE